MTDHSCLNQTFSVTRVMLSVSPSQRRAVVAALARQAARDLDRSAASLADQLIEHNPAGLATVGGGVVLLQDSLSNLDQHYLLVARLARPVDFEAVDQHPVDLVCLALSPDADRIGHIQRLGRLTRLLHDRDFVAKLRSATSADAITALFLEPAGIGLAAA